MFEYEVRFVVAVDGEVYTRRALFNNHFDALQWAGFVKTSKTYNFEYAKVIELRIIGLVDGTSTDL